MVGDRAAKIPGVVTFVARDTGGEWQVGSGDGPATARVTATASDLVLLLYRRIPLTEVDTDGDPALLDALSAAYSTE